MSGNASVHLLEPELAYQFVEDMRKILLPGTEADYWAGKRQFFNSVLHSSASQFKTFVISAKQAGIPLVSLGLQRDMLPASVAHSVDELTAASAAGEVKVQLQGAKGQTTIYLQFARPLNSTQAAQLLQLLQPLAFEQLEAQWRQQGAPSAPETAFIPGLVLAKFYERYALGVALMPLFRAEHEAYFRAAMGAYVDKLAPALEAGLQAQIQADNFWLKAEQLISLEKKLGAGFERVLQQQRPAGSPFNFYGPLFDEEGRRTSSSLGALRLSMLFVSSAAWDESLGGRRGGFETWFNQLVRSF